MEDWIVYTLFATLLYGALNFLFKVAAERGHDSDGVLTFVGLSAAAAAFITLGLTEARPLGAVTRSVLLYALFNGLFFALGSLAKYGALRRAPTAIVFPLNRLNTLAVIAIGVIFFHETPRPLQVLGIVAGLGVLAVITWEQRGHVQRAANSRVLGGILLALASALCTSLSMTVGKLLADSAHNRLAYIGASYTLVFFWSLGQNLITRRGRAFQFEWRAAEMVGFGAAIGLLNYAGYFLVLQAFGSGPISLSQAIFSSSIVVPIMLSRWFYREKLTWPRVIAIGLAMAAVVLMSIK